MYNSLKKTLRSTNNYICRIAIIRNNSYISKHFLRKFSFKFQLSHTFFSLPLQDTIYKNMGFSRIELERIISDSVQKALRNYAAVTVFSASDMGDSETFFVQAVYVDGKWCYTKTDGTEVIEGTDFKVPA